MSDKIWPEKTWTQSELGKQFPGALTLEDLINASSKMAHGDGAVVCEVVVNGLSLTEDDEARFKTSPLTEIQTFQVKLEKVEALLDESLVGCRQYLAQLSSSVEHAANLFRSEDIVAAHKFYRTCVDGASLFIEMIAHYKIVYENARGNLPSTWSDQEKHTMTLLTQILEAYKQKNYILVADMLEYDLIDLLVAWQKELQQLESITPRDHRSQNDVKTEGSVR